MLYEEVVTRGQVGGGLGGFIGRPLGAIPGLIGGLAVGGPIGGAIGLGLGSAAGGQLGKLVGKNVISDPDKAADFSKVSHRIGHLARPMTSGYGAASDALIAPGLTNIGSSIYNAASDEGAAKLGYQE